VNLADLRKEYTAETLDESSIDRDPNAQFGKWMQEAIDAQVPEPTAMSLATVGPRGRPAVRIVLLKGADEKGFVFFTNYMSRKGQELASNPAAAICFLWKELERQVRVEGTVAKVSAEESAAYYSSRPLGSRIGAWASPQSEAIDNRAWLEKRWEDFGKQHGENPECPPNWGGYRLVPDYFEFWQGRRSRLHDRIVFTRVDGQWKIARLAP
jgi:pyridoxamine 5'-phosphate oxidase